MRIIGLTGGIATGKSTVSAIFAEQGLPVLDADKIARQAVQKVRRIAGLNLPCTSILCLPPPVLNIN